MNIEAIRLKWSKDCNIIIGQSHFIKTVEDLAEIMAVSLPKAEWGIAFNEASGPCLVRTEGTDPSLIADAVACARATGAGHSFYIVIGPGAYPINILDRVKACPAILGVVDGFSPKGIEGDADKVERKNMLRRFGYKFG